MTTDDLWPIDRPAFKKGIGRKPSPSWEPLDLAALHRSGALSGEWSAPIDEPTRRDWLQPALIGGAVSALLVIAAIVAFSGSARAAGCSIVASPAVDTRMRAGQSDDAGDHKQLAAYARCNGWLGGFRVAIDTPQADRAGRQYDTAMAGLTAGREWRSHGLDVGIYATAGVINGPALSSAYAMVDRSHALSGMGASRRSPASSDGRPWLALAGRVDRSWPIVGDLGITTTGYALAGTDHVAAGGAVYLWLLRGGSADFRPSIAGLPTTLNQGSGGYAGVSVRGVAYDLATDRVGTSHVQATAVLGAQVQYGPAIVGLELSARPDCEVRGCGGRPVGAVRASIGWRLP